MLCVLAFLSNAEMIPEAYRGCGPPQTSTHCYVLRCDLQMICSSMEYWVVPVLMSSLNTPHFHTDSLLFSIPPVPVILYTRRRPSPDFSSKGDFVLRLQTDIEPKDPLGMEAALQLELVSNSLVSFSSWCPTDFFTSYSVPFSTSEVLLPYNFSLPTHAMVLHYLMVLFSPSAPTINWPVLSSIYISISWLNLERWNVISPVHHFIRGSVVMSTPSPIASGCEGMGLCMAKHHHLCYNELWWTGAVIDISSVGKSFLETEEYTELHSVLPARQL